MSRYVSSCNYANLVHAPTERAESQPNAAPDSLRLFPRRLFCHSLGGCCSLSHLYLALCARQAATSGSLSSQICTLSLSLRGHPASWRRISQLGHVARCRASITCARGMCAALGGRQRACGMKLAGDSGRKRPACAARRRHAKRASRLRMPRKPSLPCRGALLRVLLRAGQRPPRGDSRASASRTAALS